ncbi:MAG: glycosyltransferase [Clostridiales Family XIII bacterium]|jgi:glycosyltransferase involved in cell wall biosynthesis|nr:glycosyltransferase [Clostridiales Family XIII bacterium]
MISVIVPVFNAAEYLEECVSSVLDQSYSNIELILIDDGSTDGSGGMCETIAARDSRVTVIHRENGGVSRARNTGLDAAKGDIIAFLDCDDYILPGMYETLLEKMEQSGSRIAVCTVMDEQEGGSVRKVDTGETLLISGRDALRQLVCGMGERAGNRETIWFSVWNKLYDAALFKEGGGLRFDPETDSAEDVPVNLALFSAVHHILYYKKPYYFWRYRSESQSNLRAPAALRGGIRTSRYLFDYAKRFGEADRRAAVTSAIRHFYWYYTACVRSLYTARKEKRDISDYVALRADMAGQLRITVDDPAYAKYAGICFKAAILLMLHAPALFAALWLCYRKMKQIGR